MSGPLAGVRVVDLTINVLGPVATQILGDMGAEVVKVEPPGGDPMRRSGPARHPGMSGFFLSMNRNKRSVVLDLRRAEALEAVLRLAERADVFVHSTRPGSAQRLGIGYEALARRNPRLVYAFAPGYRSDGPNRDRPAFDDVIQGESGLADMAARTGGEPRFVPMVLADKFCGHTLASAIGMALYARERTGTGQQVEVPMLETMLAFNLVEHLAGAAFDPPLSPPGYDRMLSPHRRPHATKDGHICLLAVTDDQWRRLLGALGLQEVAADPRFAAMEARTRHIGELYAIVGRAIARETTAAWRERFDAADIPNAAVAPLDGLLDDPYLARTGFFERYRHPSEGDLVRTAIPVRHSATPGSVRLPPPRLGEHTAEVLAGIGYGTEDIARLGNPSHPATSATP